MGTRADFYVGRGKGAEWLGSIAWDGYPTGIAGKKHGTANGDVTTSPILTATSEEVFRAEVRAELASREDGTTPDRGWPWPWNTSHTTDYAYAFDDGKVHASCFGHPWFDPTKPRNDDEQEEDSEEAKGPRPEFPDMTERQNVTFGKRSGVMVFGF